MSNFDLQKKHENIAIKNAEIMDGKNPDNLVVDNFKELELFMGCGEESALNYAREIGYKNIDELQEGLKEKRKDIEEKYNSTHDNYHINAKKYWNDLLSTIKEDNQKKLILDKTFFSQLGVNIDGLEGIEEQDDSLTFSIKGVPLRLIKDEGNYRLHIDIYGRGQNIYSLYENTISAPYFNSNNPNKKFVEKNINIGDLYNPETYRVFKFIPDYSSFTSLISNLNRTVKLINRSTDQKTQEKMKIKEKISILEKKIEDKYGNHIRSDNSFFKGEYIEFQVELLNILKRLIPILSKREKVSFFYHIIEKGGALTLDFINIIDNLKDLDLIYSDGVIFSDTLYKIEILENFIAERRGKINKNNPFFNNLESNSKFTSLYKDTQTYIRKLFLNGKYPENNVEKLLIVIKNSERFIRHGNKPKAYIEIFCDNYETKEELSKAINTVSGLNELQLRYLLKITAKKGVYKLQKKVNRLKKYNSNFRLNVEHFFMMNYYLPDKKDKIVLKKINTENNYDKKRDFIKVLKEFPNDIKKIIFRINKLNKEYNNYPYFLLIGTFNDLNPREINILNNLSIKQKEFIEWVVEKKFYFGDSNSAYEFLTLLQGINSIIRFDYIKRITSTSKDSIKLINIINILEKYKKTFDIINKKGELGRYHVELINNLIGIGINDDKLTKVLDNILSLDYYTCGITQKIVTKDNYVSILNNFSTCTDECKNISSTIFDSVVKYFITLYPDPENVIELIKRFSKIINDKNSFYYKTYNIVDIFLILGKKSQNYQELEQLIQIFESDFAIKLNNIEKTKYNNIEYNKKKIIITYIRNFIDIDEIINNSNEVLNQLKKFLNKANKESYSFKKDPQLEGFESLYGPLNILNKRKFNEFNLSYILNVMVGKKITTKENKEIVLSKSYLKKKALDFLNSKDKLLQVKGAKLLVGLGINTDELGYNDLLKVSQIGVDKKLTKYEVTSLIINEYYSYIEGKNIPLSLFFSILMTIKEEKSTKGLTKFKQKIDIFKKIENQEVYAENFLAIVYDDEDRTHSHFFEEDSFNPIAHENMIKLKSKTGKITTHRYGKKNENLESMMTSVEISKGDYTFLIGGHGNKNIISFGGEKFNIDILYNRLAKRLENNNGNKWKTKIIFESCYSEYNSKLLMNMWYKNQKTKDFPLTIITSSSEQKSSYKMASDSWYTESLRLKKEGQPLTWGDFYRNIESKNFILTNNPENRWHGVNSNISVYINGKKVG